MRYKPIKEITWSELLKCDGYNVKYNIRTYSAMKDGIGKLTIQGDNIYICQNDADGTGCKDKKGFKYSWILEKTGSSSALYSKCITEIEIPESGSMEEETSLKKENLIEGECYHFSRSDWSSDYVEYYNFNGKYPTISKSKGGSGGWSFCFDSGSGSSADFSCVQIRKATAEEKDKLYSIMKERGIHLPNSSKKEETSSKFEVGRWYKRLGSSRDYIAKLSRFSENTFHVHEYIYAGKYEKISHEGNIGYNHDTIECPLSEIQQYLPNGHVDKISSEKDWTPRDVPEYVEVVNAPTQWCKKGEILQFKKVGDSYHFKYNEILNSSNRDNWDSYGSNYSLKELYSKYFKKSTKEAFEFQFKGHTVNKYFGKDPKVQKLEDITRDWIRNVTKFKSAQTGTEQVFRGIGTICDYVIWNEGGSGSLYYHGIYASKIEEDEYKWTVPVTNPKQKSSFDEKAYLSKPENQVMPIKKVNKQKSTIKFY